MVFCSSFYDSKVIRQFVRYINFWIPAKNCGNDRGDGGNDVGTWEWCGDMGMMWEWCGDVGMMWGCGNGVGTWE